MPVPSEGMIQGLALSALTSGSDPRSGPTLSAAVARVMASACRRFMERVHVSPGIPCAITSTPVQGPAVGTVVGVGTLVGVAVTDTEVRLDAEQAARGAALSTADQDRFVKVVEPMVSMGLKRFQELAQMLPGTPVAGGMTLVPARLTCPVSGITAQLSAQAIALNPPQAGGGWTAARPQVARMPGAPMMGGHRGSGASAPPPPALPSVELPADFPQIVATLMGQVLDQFVTMVMVAPGIRVGFQATETPGTLT